MKTLRALFAAVTALALAACAGFTAAPQTLQAGTYFGASRLLENSSADKKPARTAALAAAATELAALTPDTATSAALAAVLTRHLSDDRDLRALAMLILAWVPPGAADGADLAAAAHNIALGINAALPVQ